MLKGVQM